VSNKFSASDRRRVVDVDVTDDTETVRIHFPDGTIEEIDLDEDDAEDEDEKTDPGGLE
jgi:hypothetical protein